MGLTFNIKAICTLSGALKVAEIVSKTFKNIIFPLS